MSEVKTDSVVNVSGDSDSGIDLSTNDVVAIKTADSERARVDADGHVGINNTSPGSYLEGELVVGNSTKDQYISVVTGTGNAAGLCFQDQTGTSIVGGLRYTHSDNALQSWTNGSERMRIDSSGDIAVPGNNGVNLITADHSAAASATNRQGIHMSGGQFVIHSGSGTADIDAIKLFTSHGGAGGSSFAKLALNIQSDGDVFNKNNSYGQISDQRLKQDIADAASQWDDIKAVQVKKFRFKDAVANLGSDNVPLQIGVIAQDLEASGMGGLVIEQDDIVDGVDQGTTTKKVKYSVLYMKAVKALQEAMTRIETLETQNTTQATQIADLITRVTALEDA